MTLEKRFGPAEDRAESKGIADGDKVIIIDPREIPAYVDAGFVLLVAVTSITRGTTRRRVYFNLPSASGAVRRAERRGDLARVVLAKLVPVGDTR